MKSLFMNCYYKCLCIKTRIKHLLGRYKRILFFTIIWFLCHFYFHNCLVFVSYVLTCLSNRFLRFLRLIVVGVLYKVLLELWLKILVCMHAKTKKQSKISNFKFKILVLTNFNKSHKSSIIMIQLAYSMNTIDLKRFYI